MNIIFLYYLWSVEYQDIFFLVMHTVCIWMLIHTDINAANLSLSSGVKNYSFDIKFEAFTVDICPDDEAEIV